MGLNVWHDLVEVWDCLGKTKMGISFSNEVTVVERSGQ